MNPPILSSPTDSSIHINSRGESLNKDAYRSPIILSDFSDNDMDTSVNQVYHVTEASDEEECGALLKGPSESCESGPCMKMLKFEMLGCIVRRLVQPLANNHAIVARSKSQCGALVKEGGRNHKGSKVIVNSLTHDRDENLFKVFVNDLFVCNGCGGGPNSATWAP
ncbi:hypothetical protein M0R45_019576 [Rubus argutus]|uniref:Uncharacterized protein n=1 Tax=Rubus argutus TaxID=59490 RepID=A0AAW1X7R4_RUBAR